MNLKALWIIPTGMACGGAGAWSFLMLSRVAYWPTDSSSMASWVQALGSIAALAVTGFTVWWQAQKTMEANELRDKAEQLSLLTALHDELDMSLKNYQQMFGRVVDEIEQGKFLDEHFFSPREPFPIYVSSAAQLGRVQDDKLRRSIMEAYSTANTLLQTLRRNSALLDDLALAQRNDPTHGVTSFVFFADIKLKKYAPIVQQVQAGAYEKVNQAKLMIRQYLDIRN